MNPETKPTPTTSPNLQSQSHSSQDDIMRGNYNGANDSLKLTVSEDRQTTKNPQKPGFLAATLERFLSYALPSTNDEESIPSERAGNITIPSSAIDDASRFAKADISQGDISILLRRNVNNFNSRIKHRHDISNDLSSVPLEQTFGAGIDHSLSSDTITVQIRTPAQSIAIQSKFKKTETVEPEKSEHKVARVPVVKSSSHVSEPDPEQKPSGGQKFSFSALKNVFSLKTITELPANTDQRSGYSQLFIKIARILLLSLLIIGSSLLIAIFGAVTSYSYNSPNFQLYGTAVIDGVFLGVYIIMIMREFMSPSRTKDHLVPYSNLPWYHTWVLFQTVAITFGLTIAFERGSQKSIYWYGFYKGIAVLAAMLIYCKYFRKKMLQVKKIEERTNRGSKKSFFFTRIYKNFLDELYGSGVRLQTPIPQAMETANDIKDSQKRGAKRHKSISDIIANRSAQWARHTVEKTPSDKVLVIDFIQICGLTAIIFIPFIQLLVAFAIDSLFATLRDSYTSNLCYIAIAVYPVLSWTIRSIVIWIDTASRVNFGNSVLYIATAFGTLPFRVFFFRAQALEQAIYMILISIGYKVLVYVIYGILWKSLRSTAKKLGEKLKEKCQKKSRTPQRRRSSLFQRPSQIANMQRFLFRMGISSDNQNQKLQHFEALAMRFEVLQICDISQIFAFWIVLMCFYGYRDVVVNSFNLLSVGVFDAIKVSSPVEISLEIVFWLLVGVIWKLVGNLKGTNIWSKIKETVRETTKIYFFANTILFFTFFLALERYGYAQYS